MGELFNSKLILVNLYYLRIGNLNICISKENKVRVFYLTIIYLKA